MKPMKGRASTANPNEEVYLVIKVKRGAMPKIRKWLHAQEWYSGDDVPIANGIDYFGHDTRPVYAALTTYWENWKRTAQRHREMRNKKS